SVSVYALVVGAALAVAAAGEPGAALSAGTVFGAQAASEIVTRMASAWRMYTTTPPLVDPALIRLPAARRSRLEAADQPPSARVSMLNSVRNGSRNVTPSMDRPCCASSVNP